MKSLTMFRWLFQTAILSALMLVSTQSLAEPLGLLRVSAETSSEVSVEAPRAKAIKCLALNIFFEARSEGTKGWLAVAFVTINRVNDDRFPDKLCEVVWEPKQFSWTHDGLSDKPDLSKSPDRKSWEYILEFSRGFYDNYEYIDDPTNGSLYYHANSVEPIWRNSFEVAAEIGEHIFYINNRRHR